MYEHTTTNVIQSSEQRTQTLTSCEEIKSPPPPQIEFTAPWFAVAVKPSFELHDAQRDCHVVCYPEYVTAEAGKFVRDQLDAVPDSDWCTGKLFGHPVPRLIRWYHLPDPGKAPCGYKFGGRVWPPFPYSAWRVELQQALESDIRERIDPTLRPLRSVLDNKYNGGSIARHSDDEREFQPQPGIASLSFGVTRTFYLQLKDKSEPPFAIPLADRTLIYMWGNTQEWYDHWIDKEPLVVGIRYNMTFRPHIGQRFPGDTKKRLKTTTKDIAAPTAVSRKRKNSPSSVPARVSAKVKQVRMQD